MSNERKEPPPPNPHYTERLYSSQSGLRFDLEVSMPGGYINEYDFLFIEKMLGLALNRMQRRVKQDSDLAPCPMGCGGFTEDVAGGPCDKCWQEVDDDDDWDEHEDDFDSRSYPH